MILDFPLAWELVRTTNPEDHHEKCSYRQSNGAFLCDCAAIKIAQSLVDIINERYEIQE